MGQSARELSQLLRGALHDYFVQATQQNTDAARTNNLLTNVLTALQSQPGTQVFQYFDQRQHHVLTSIQNVIEYAPQYRQQINFDQRIQIGRVLLQNVVNLLVNQQIQVTPQNVNGALQAITGGQLSLQDMRDVAIPLPDGTLTSLPQNPLNPVTTAAPQAPVPCLYQAPR